MKKLKHPFRLRAKHALHSARRQRRRTVRRALFTAAAMSFGLMGAARAESSPLAAPANPTSRQSAETPEQRLARWQESFDAFAAADRLHAPTPGGVLFVGSSSIRMWDSLEQDFQSLPVVTKRGFGGSRLSDCSDQVARLVLPYKPAVVIVYAGDNDLAEGATPAEVTGSFRRFVESVRRELPNTRIAYLSIKPSPLRASLLPQIRETNSLIAAYSATVGNLDYIDIFSRMVSAEGQPRPEFFGPDMLHMNRAGYTLWRNEITAHLGPVSAAAPAVAGATPPSTLAGVAVQRAAP